MALNDAQRNEFIDAFTKALVSSWSSEEYAQRLESDPRSAFAEVGLVLPENARIEVVRNFGEGGIEPIADEKAGLDLQVQLYETGLETGHFEFHMPSTPQIDLSELDVDELSAIAGGGFYCCCCPCSCCS